MLFLESLTVGVGHFFCPRCRRPSAIATSSAKILPPFPFGRLPGLAARGVGHNPDSVSFVRCPGVDSAQNSPFCIIPQRGQVSENSIKPPRSEHWGVFHEYEFGLYFAHDPCHFGPQS